MIIWLRINAFLALLTSAVVVSLLACVNKPEDFPDSIDRIARAFGGATADIGIVIGLAAVIGQCMMESGAADRIVRAFLRLLGEKRSPWALMGSGYVLAVPVFFDTVFYLLVPLARSFYKRTGKNYLLCILAIAAGGAITHTLVPPTPPPTLPSTHSSQQHQCVWQHMGSANSPVQIHVNLPGPPNPIQFVQPTC